MLVSPLPPSVFDTYSLSTLSLEYKRRFFTSFLVLLFICFSSSCVHFKNGPKYLTSGTAQVFISFMRFLFGFELFLHFPAILFFNFLSFISTCLVVSPSSIAKSL